MYAYLPSHTCHIGKTVHCSSHLHNFVVPTSARKVFYVYCTLRTINVNTLLSHKGRAPVFCGGWNWRWRGPPTDLLRLGPPHFPVAAGHLLQRGVLVPSHSCGTDWGRNGFLVCNMRLKKNMCQMKYPWKVFPWESGLSGLCTRAGTRMPPSHICHFSPLRG